MSSKLTKNEISSQEAAAIIKKIFPDINITNIIDFKDMYIIDGALVFIGLISINKITGEIGGFNPMTLDDPDEYFSKL